jgi:hypothetical protein
MVSIDSSLQHLKTYIDSGQIHAHILSKLALSLRCRFGVLLKFALQNFYLILPKSWFRLVRSGRWLRYTHRRWLLVSHRSVTVHVMLRIRVHLIVMLLEVMISWLFEVLHADYRSDPGFKLEDDCTCQSPSLVV